MPAADRAAEAAAARAHDLILGRLRVGLAGRVARRGERAMRVLRAVQVGARFRLALEHVGAGGEADLARRAALRAARRVDAHAELADVGRRAGDLGAEVGAGRLARIVDLAFGAGRAGDLEALVGDA